MTNPLPSAAANEILLSNEEGVKNVLVDSIFQLWDVVNNLTRLRPTSHERFRVSIFGSARAKPDTFVYNEVKRIAAALGEIDCDILTGGGPGLMQAANEGAGQGKAVRSVGIRVDLPFEQEVNPFVTQEFEHKTFFTRLHHFVLASDAFIIVPGGIGTVLELMMVWQLLQVRHVRKVPLILVGKMWEELVVWAKEHLLRDDLQLANPADLEIPTCVASADEAIALVRQHHADWQQAAKSSS